jgi:hypothetical protein
MSGVLLSVRFGWSEYGPGGRCLAALDAGAGRTARDAVVVVFMQALRLSCYAERCGGVLAGRSGGRTSA